MNVIICTPLPALRTSIAKKLLLMGDNIVNLNTLEEVYAAIPARGHIALIDDKSFDISELLPTVIKIKKEKPGSRVVLLTRILEMQLIKDFVRLGIDLVLQSSLHLETIVEKFVRFIQKVPEQHSSRRYLRIKLEEEDGTIIQLLMSSHYFIKGKITDISMGGIAAQFAPSDMERLVPGTVYFNAKINLVEKIIQADIKLLKKGGNVAAFCFEEMRSSYQDALAEFVYFKTQKL